MNTVHRMKPEKMFLFKVSFGYLSFSSDSKNHDYKNKQITMQKVLILENFYLRFHHQILHKLMVGKNYGTLKSLHLLYIVLSSSIFVIQDDFKLLSSCVCIGSCDL